MVRLENICNTEKTLWFRWGSCLIEHGGRSTYDTHSPAVNTQNTGCAVHTSVEFSITPTLQRAGSVMTWTICILIGSEQTSILYQFKLTNFSICCYLSSVLRLLLMCVWLLVFNLYFMFHYFLCVCVWECVFHPYNEIHPCVGCFSAKSRRDRGKNWRRKNME